MVLSIVIPAYNVENFLQECVRSFFCQIDDYSCFEVIIVNDGSLDNTLQVACDLETEFPNVKVVNQKNQGAAFARNNGLKKCKGEFVSFFDADDICAAGSFKGLINLIKKNKSDCVLVKQLRTDASLNVIKLNASEQYYFSEAFVARLNGKKDLLSSISILDFPYRLIVKRSFLLENRIEFCTDIVTYEDVLFALQVYSKIHSFVFYNIPFYLYRYNFNSITQKDNSYLKQQQDFMNLMRVVHFCKKETHNKSLCFVHDILLFYSYKTFIINKLLREFKNRIYFDCTISTLSFCKMFNILRQYSPIRTLLLYISIFVIVRSHLYRFVGLKRCYE